MTGDDGLYDEMRHQPPGPDSFRSDPLALDEGTAERLLAGTLDPADAPPAYRRAAMVLAAVSAEPGPEELAGEARAVRSLAKVARSIPHRAPTRRSPVLSKVLSLKAAAAAAFASLVLAGVAGAATNTLPEPAQRVAHQMLGAAGVHSPEDRAGATHGTNGHETTSHATGPGGTAAQGPTGPDASGPAREGLCRAWQSGQGGEEGKKDQATAFKALAAAAGGADKVADYCKDVTQGSGDHGQSSPPTTTPEHGQPQDPGQGSGNGGAQSPGAGSGSGQGQAPPSTTPDHNS
jgi:hypothetical protein